MRPPRRPSQNMSLAGKVMRPAASPNSLQQRGTRGLALNGEGSLHPCGSKSPPSPTAKSSTLLSTKDSSSRRPNFVRRQIIVAFRNRPAALHERAIVRCECAWVCVDRADPGQAVISSLGVASAKGRRASEAPPPGCPLSIRAGRFYHLDCVSNVPISIPRNMYIAPSSKNVSSHCRDTAGDLGVLSLYGHDIKPPKTAVFRNSAILP